VQPDDYPVDIQRQLLDQNRTLLNTTAGSVLVDEIRLKNLIEELKKDLLPLSPEDLESAEASLLD
jgi:hypothetical protein